jgi:hypothetical protein|tara:strand:- start:107043 stop:107501 length:459 start_codon:yes stop_codon:yes gene_type:complete
MSNVKRALEQREQDTQAQNKKFEKYKTACLQKAFDQAATDTDGLVDAMYNDTPYRVYFEPRAMCKYGPSNLLRACNAAFRNKPPRKFFPCEGEENAILAHPEYQSLVAALDDKGIMVEDARIGYDESIRFYAVVAEIPAMYEYVDLKIALKP